MINFGPKTKVSKKPKKANAPSKAARRPERNAKDALTREDIAEINLFSTAIAKMNVAADARRRFAGYQVK
jgi:hypothetical protein